MEVRKMSGWIDGAMFYHIYPLGFCGAERFNAEFDGTEGRILKVLDWIEHLRRLNITAVYFGPVFESVEHGYDTADYRRIDRRLGTNADFAAVCRALHENGIRVVLDGVFNHVGRDFFAFRDVCEKGAASQYCGWFHRLDFGGRSPMGDPFSYEGWSGYYNLVKLNLRNSEVSNYLSDCIRAWIDEFDIDGIRFDVADCLDKDFIKSIHNLTRSIKPDFWLMGEVIHGNYSEWANGEMFDSVTNYQCYKGIYSSHNDLNMFEIAHNIDQQIGQYGSCKGLRLYSFLDNHDVNRIASTLKNPKHLFTAYTLMYMMCGVPSVYYGSEFGIRGEKANGSDAALRPCIKLSEMQGSAEELCRHIAALGAARLSHTAVRSGEYQRLLLNNRQLMFRRFDSSESICVAINIDDSPFTFTVATASALVDLLSGKKYPSVNGSVAVTLGGCTSAVLADEENASKEEERTVKEKPKTTAAPSPAAGQRYRHFKGRIYTVKAIALNSETLEEMVVYEDGEHVWVRPKAMFCETVERDGVVLPRFELIE